MKEILLLGASGSIGKQTIDIIDQHQDYFKIVGISVGHNIDFLKEFLKNHSVKYVYSINENVELVKQYPNIIFFNGKDGLIELTNTKYDLCVNALQGFVGLLPTINVLKKGIDVALANKETLVAAGEIVTSIAKENNCKIIPIDSEHSAIYQCLKGNNRQDINKIIITASGGPFFKLSREELKNVNKQDVLKHPNWSMGNKITVDSATMMNKGFEVIEAHYLYDISYENIETIIHPNSIIHSLVEYKDHCILAQLGVPDMRMPIQYALSLDERLNNNSQSLDLTKQSLNFYPMDYNRFPLLKLAYDLGKKGGNLPAIMNGANQASVELFLNDKIKFTEIEELVFKAIEKAKFIAYPTIEEIVESNDWAMEFVREMKGE